MPVRWSRSPGRTVGLRATCSTACCTAWPRSRLVGVEGDGAGVLTDIPRAIWSNALRASGHDPAVVRGGRFAVGHVFIPPSDAEADQAAVRRSLARHGIEILVERDDTTDSSVLGPRGRTEEPRFWQLA